MLSLELEELLELNPPQNEKQIQDLLLFIREWLFEVVLERMIDKGWKKVPRSEGMVEVFYFTLINEILYLNRVMNIVKKNTNTNYWANDPFNEDIEVLSKYIKKHLQ